MNREIVKKFLKNNPSIAKILSFIFNRLPFNNRISIGIGKKNELENHGILNKCKIKIVGENNYIYIGTLSRLKNTVIYISGDNNKVYIGDDVRIIDGNLHIEDDLGGIEIGSDTAICGKTHLAVIEGTKILIGKGCLFSSSIVVRTGDSHSILDLDGNRVNYSKSVIIGNHVWVGNQVIILKGVRIPENTIVGTGAVVTKSFDNSNIIIGGIPATIIKKNIIWRGERI